MIGGVLITGPFMSLCIHILKMLHFRPVTPSPICRLSRRKVIGKRLWITSSCSSNHASSPPYNFLIFWHPYHGIQNHTHQSPEPDRTTSNSASHQNDLANQMRLRRNHYSGSQGLANYGYVFINGQWVDPDSSGEVFLALTNTGPPAPDPLRDLTKGPRIMSDLVSDVFYKEYTAELVEGGDCEGDPRSLRISPTTFAQWAIGCSAGDHYTSTYVPVPQVCQLSINPIRD